MRILLSPWPWFGLAALTAFDYMVTHTVAGFTASLIARVVNVIPG